MLKTFTMKADVLLGLQWGDEGKGKVVDVLAPRYDVIARFQRMRGKADVKWRTDDLMALLRGDD